MSEDLLQRMAANHVDFNLFFRSLCDAAAGTETDERVRTLFAEPAAYDLWAVAWRLRLGEEAVAGHVRAAAMRQVNPAYIPRNHMVQAALDAASEQQNFQPFEELLDVVSLPYEDRPEYGRYAVPARPEERVTQTFCGT